MLIEEWKRRKALVEEALIRELDASDIIDDTLGESMRYSLMAGGKRLRPMLLMAAADAAGGNGDDYLTSACSMEMIHTYSLIHDDLPAMDNDDYRRGKLTNHKVYGAGMATLAGDALLTLAFEVLFRQKGVSSDKLVAAAKEISIAAGVAGMVGGQAIDIESEGKKISRDTLYKMHMGKTGALFRASVRGGAILAGASDEVLSALTDYSEKFGFAFQITDDILDVTGDESKIGKPTGSDERNKKSTYVTLASLDEARRLARETVEGAKGALAQLGDSALYLKELADFLINRDR